MPDNAETKPSPAWTDPDLVNPHAKEDKAGRVRQMFTAIAPAYDLNNHLHSLWRDQAWRRYAVRRAQVKPGEVVVDVACGTGDLTQAFAKTPASRVIGIDFTHEMLRIAGVKRTQAEAGSKITYMEGDAQKLPLADACCDVVSIAFGIRNVMDPRRALAEFFRVLRPGGRLVILEFDRPKNPLVRWFNDFYSGKVMPRTATWISGDRSGAYRYLPKSVETFLTREEMVQAMRGVGFMGVEVKGLTLGICACYRAQRQLSGT